MEEHLEIEKYLKEISTKVFLENLRGFASFLMDFNKSDSKIIIDCGNLYKRRSGVEIIKESTDTEYNKIVWQKINTSIDTVDATNNKPYSEQIIESRNYFTDVSQQIEFDEYKLNELKNYDKETKKIKIEEEIKRSIMEMLRGIQESLYISKRGTLNTDGIKQSLQFGGLDWFIRNESQIAGKNLAGATGAGMGEINVGSTTNTTEVNKKGLKDAIIEILTTPIPDGKRYADFVAFCTTSFAMAIGYLFGTDIVYDNKIGSKDLTAIKIKSAYLEVPFVVDKTLDELNRNTKGEVAKIAYFVPMKFTKLICEDGSKTYLSIKKIGWYKRLLSSNISIVFRGIKSGAYRKVKLMW